MPKLSILLSTRNQADWLVQCVEAIRIQTFTDWELLIFNDFSSDRTSKFLKGISSKDDRIFSYKPNSHKGPIFGYNFLLSKAVGKFIWTVASDDFCIQKDFLRDGFLALSKMPHLCGFCSACETFFEPSGKKGPRMVLNAKEGVVRPEKVVNGFFNHHGNIPGSSMVVKKSLVDSLGGYRQELGPMCDLFVNHALGSRFGLFYFQIPCVAVRIHECANGSFGQNICITDWARILAQLEISLRAQFPKNSFSEIDWIYWRFRRINDFLKVEHRFRQIKKGSGVCYDDEKKLKNDIQFVIFHLNKNFSLFKKSNLVFQVDSCTVIKFIWSKPFVRIFSRFKNSIRKRFLGYTLPF